MASREPRGKLRPKDFRCGYAMAQVRGGRIQLDPLHSDRAAELGLSRAGYMRWYYDLEERDREVHGLVQR